MEENDNVNNASQYKDAEYKIGNDNGFVYTCGVDTSFKILEGPKIKYKVLIPWLNLNTNIVLYVNDNIKWYTILMFKLFGCKLEKVTVNDKSNTLKVPLRQQIYNKLNNLLKKLLNVEDVK